MHLTDLCHDLIKIPGKTGTIPVTGLAVDSKRVEAGDIFFAIAGNQYDGRDFIKNAIGAGAVAIVTGSTPLAQSLTKMTNRARIPILQCDNPRRIMAQMAARVWPSQPGMIAAVTGTNGKTSTTEFLRQLWRRATWQAVAVGTLGVTGTDMIKADGAILSLPPLTTPDSISLHGAIAPLAKAGVTHLALEASSHGLSQYRLDGMNIHLAAFTNLSRDHLDHHADMDSYFSAKIRLFTELLSEGGCAAINLDDPYSAAIMEALKGRAIVVKTFGFAENADFHITSITPAGDGLNMRVTYNGHSWDIPLALSGTFQAINALTAAVMGYLGGLPLHDSLGALPYLKAAPGRMQTVHGHPKGARVVVDYAHTPDALAAALGALRPEASGKLFVLFGCGGERDPGKREMMGQVACQIADYVIVTDDNPRNEDPTAIRSSILNACDSAVEIVPRDEAIATVLAQLDGGDVLLIAGKGHETGQLIGNETLPFDDAALVSNRLRAMQGAK
ncbi:UDP-N-acetylmuramoyl-L-alanyl-D-glutamate--2,6-diaminopimelate ligase [Candidatus Puniceispirillum sp.]|nr:UDP-N-acetylmuramoyl-L-alanyl-D-glutamate--2,6-diaminopimelate ligase [Candidatus Puniceispirillum sp.]